MVVRLPFPDPPLARISIEQYHRMVESGALTENDHLELIEGLLVQKMPRNTPHDVSIDLLTEHFWKLLPTGLRFRSQCAITLSNSEPEPDGAVVLGPAQRYKQSHPQPEEILLVAEISDSTLDFDRGRKQRIYARAGIAIYWIVNLVERQVEVYTQPQPLLDEPCYAQRQDFREGEAVPVVLQGQSVGSILVVDLLPAL